MKVFVVVCESPGDNSEVVCVKTTPEAADRLCEEMNDKYGVFYNHFWQESEVEE